MSLFTIVFEAGLAVLMTVLIIYCVILNKRLAAIRSQDTDIKEMTASFEAASQRAEESVAHIKAAGLAAERSLRAAIEDAEGVKASMSATPRNFASPVDNFMAPHEESPMPWSPLGGDQGVSQMKDDNSTPEGAGLPISEDQSPDRQQAEMAVLNAIRSARTEA
jgi:hypothetical protein